MTPFQTFRLWCRRAPLVQKTTAATAAMTVLAALVWTVVPASPHSAPASSSLGGSTNGSQALGTTTTTAAGTAAGPVTTTTPASTPTPSGGAPASPSAGTSGTHTATTTPARTGTTSSPHCVSPPGNPPGTTATQINLAVIIVDIAGAAGNSTFGIVSPQDQQTAFQAVINNINASGGVACRKLVPQFFTLNPVDQSQLQAACLTIAQAGVFAVIDPGAYANYATGLSCYAQNHLPYFDGYDLASQQVQQLYPYMFAFDTLDSAYKNSVFGLKQAGFFSPSNGFAKLGIIYRDCYPQIVSEELAWLNQAGVSSSQISSYDMGCPTAFASPSDIENAIIQFKTAGVTNITEVDELGDMATFTTAAQTQGFDPKWGIADDGELEISNGTQAPNSTNLNGAIAIAASRNGENNTAGMLPTAGTAKCNAILQTVGLAPIYKQPAAIGNACDQLWMFQDAVDNAPALSPTALAAGLQRTGSIDFSYPQGPNNFTASGTTVGGQFWRVDQYSKACSCWQVTNPNWQPTF